MFEFLRRRPKDLTDPLATPQMAAAWFRGLPVRDVIGRQQHVLHALGEMAHLGKPIDANRIAAIEWLDAALAADRGQLIKQYADNAVVSGAAARRVWQAADELCQALTGAYRMVFDAVIASSAGTQQKSDLPRIGARLMHYYGTDAKLRVLRSEPLIPGKWAELHRLYLRSIDLGIERAPVEAISPELGSAPRTIEQEYIAILLTQLLNTGTLGAAEIDWAGTQLRAWCSGLLLEPNACVAGGFCVDLAGQGGLVRCTDIGGTPMTRYLDTMPMVDKLERTMAQLQQQKAAVPDASGLTIEQRLSVLGRLRPVLAHGEHFAPDRTPRVSVRYPAEVRIGLNQITLQFTSKSDAEDAFEATTAANESSGQLTQDIAHFGESKERRQAPREGERPRIVPREAAQGSWKIEDRSATGLRLSASGAEGQALALGTLIAVRQARTGNWVLGVVRRINRTPSLLEVGVSIISSAFVRVGLHAKRHAREDMSFVVDGIDVSTIGSRFSGLYLPPPSRPENPVSMKTLIIPTSEYGHGRRVILITARSVYTVALNKAFEQRPEWTWAAIEIVGKTPRAA